MATIGNLAITYADWAKRMDDNYKVANIIEILSQTNEILDDMLVMEGNLPTGHKTTIRTGLPQATWRLLNAGVPNAKSTTAQIDEQAGMLEAWSEVDVDLAALGVGDAEGDVLHRRGDEALLGLGHGVPLVGVDTDAEDRGARAGRLGNLGERAIAGLAAGSEDDVSALGELLLGLVATPHRVGEGVVASRVVDREDLDVGLDRLCTSLEALGELLHRRDLQAENLTELAGLGQLGGEDAGGVAGLVLGEDEAGVVRRGVLLRLGLVDTDELDVRRTLRGSRGGVGHEEADGDDGVVLLVGELLDVRRVVLGVGGLDVLRLGAGDGLHGSLDAFPGGLVEGLVVDLAGVGDQADAEDGCVGAVAVVARRARGAGAGAGGTGAAATGGQPEGESCRRTGDQVTLGLH